MLVSTVLFVLLCEFVSMRMMRLSTRAVPPGQGVSSVSCMRPTNIKYVSACNPQQSHRELLSTRKHPP